ncbi:penicillin-binding protein 2 [Acaricomes phytoseiuli]|uniref:peptidoglycan D,D-transpeptidase FtsI family protein n=1 Tax=Acaricomes phytoseiuli TaxID=291968 RepID=UPI000A0129AA|nr:penicillin-binding protein 2 [Acaricomes phytoseiuli]MCW1249545.1 penicillin-binding protein 2 [Acaricomes phytoseiuli]
MLALMLLVSGKLLLVQGFDLGGNAEAAEKQRTQVQTLAATRGKILDANGKVLAETVLRYDIVVDQVNNAVAEFTRLNPDTQQRDTISRDQGISELAGLLGMPEADVRSAVTGDQRYNVVAKRVTPDVEQKIAALRIPGISAEATPQRIYPMGPVAGNIVGFINEDGSGSGLEYTMNKELSGENGSRTYQMGKDGILIPTAPVQVDPAQDGETVQLTINADIQFMAQQAIADQVRNLNAAWGNIVVIEAKTGNVVAMAEDTTMDPNKPGDTAPEIRDSRAVTNAIEPGSTEKAVTAAAAIEEGKVDPLTQMVIPPQLTIGGQTIKDAMPHGTINRTFAGVIGDSLNTGTVMVGSQLSRQQRYDYLNSFGIGQPTGIPLPGESPGILAPAEQWDGRQEYTVLFGQGVAQTPLQTAMIYQTLANGGVRLQPRLVDSTTNANGTVEEAPASEGTQVVSQDTAQQMRDILESAITATPNNKASVPGYRVGGKTGTAESPAAGGFNGYTASFAGMAPMDDPQYVILVTVQHPQGDIFGISQGPVFSNVMTQVLQEGNVPPSNTPSVKLPQSF